MHHYKTCPPLTAASISITPVFPVPSSELSRVVQRLQQGFAMGRSLLEYQSIKAIRNAWQNSRYAKGLKISRSRFTHEVKQLGLGNISSWAHVLSENHRSLTDRLPPVTAMLGLPQTKATAVASVFP